MKKTILLLIIIIFKFIPAKAQWVTIPDANFVAWLTQEYPSCMSGNQLNTGCSQIINEDTLIVYANLGIQDISGIEYFVNLKKLTCYGNFIQSVSALPSSILDLSCNGYDITDLPQLPPNLKNLNCSYSSINTLPQLPSGLKILICNNTLLTNLPTLPSTIEVLNCSGNGALFSLPVLPAQLMHLECQQCSLNDLQNLPSNLVRLYCAFNQLTILPSLPPSLVLLACTGNQLDSLPTLPGNLDTLFCDNNQLTSIPSIPNSMTYLDCANNLISNFPPNTNQIVTLDCRNNLLTALPTLQNNYLKVLYCTNNLLTSLPSLPNNLVILQCDYNFLTSLPPFSGSTYLSQVICSYNQLTSLPTLNYQLVDLDCSHNQLTSLPNLFGIYLNKLNCSNNQLAGNLNLPILTGSYFEFDCSFNQISSFSDFSSNMVKLICNNNQLVCLPTLSNYIAPNSPWVTNFNISNNPISCLPNYIAAMDSATLAIPLCVANDFINNPNNCNPSMGFEGKVYSDANTNCLFDVSDSTLKNIAISFLDTISNQFGIAYTFSGGQYNYVTGSGTYQIQLDTLNKPFTYNCSNPGVDTMITISSFFPLNQELNFDVKCKPNIDLKVQSVATTGLVFPGQNHTLNTIIGDISQWYGLNCADGDSGLVSINISGPVTFVGVPLGALTPTVNGNTFTYNISNFGNVNINTAFTLILNTNTTAQSGNQVCVEVTIQTNSTETDTLNNYLLYCYNVVNSYDPNYKEVFPVNVLPGYNDWLTFTIHFQNTGTAPAINIQLQDTINNNLDEHTFEVINFSHYNETSLQNHVASFKFPNIFLPDSTSNLLGSQGFIQYRIKPKNNLPEGTQIENTAYIYFDYNAPVITNTTLNNFEFPVKSNNIRLEDEQYVLYPNPSTGLFMFNPDSYRENKNIKTVEVFNMMGELVLSQGNVKLINLQGFSKGIYMARINGTQVCRLVKE